MSAFDLEKFAPSRLDDLEGLRDALSHLQACWDLESDPETIITKLLSIPNLFPYVFSVWPGSRHVIDAILDLFPNDGSLVAGSFAGALLTQISNLLFSLPPNLFLTETSRKVGQYRFYIENALAVLKFLCSPDFYHYAKKTKGKPRQKNDVPTIDETPFRHLGIAIPSGAEEAMQTLERIMGILKGSTQFYLHLLLDPDLAAPLRDAYIPVLDAAIGRAPEPQPLESDVGFPETETEASAYPFVQPIEAALYFDNAHGFGEWHILISTNASKKMRGLRRADAKCLRILIKKIKELSHGHFSRDNQKRLNGPSSSVPIFTAKMQRDLRLVYQVDCIPTHDGDVERQVVRVYDICTHTQLNRIWDALGQYLGGKGEEYRRRCIFRNPPLEPGGDVYLPASFPPEISPGNSKQTSLGFGNKDILEELHCILVLEKYETFSQAFLHGLIANEDTQHIFEMTPEEHRIAQCRASCYVLGRSGTGKTTTMMFKMLGIQRAWETQGFGTSKPRQIFVTKAKLLALKVEECFAKMLQSQALADYTIEELAKLKASSMVPGLFEVEDASDSSRGLPQKYSELGDHHFPLFVTFDHLLRMIAADVLGTDHPWEKQATKLFVPPDDIDMQDSLVTYDVFAKRYWPHLCRDGLDSWLVFSEFIGIIRGSENTLARPDGCLDKETYCNLSSRSNPMFARQREAIYSIFQAYCKLKRQYRQHDIADRTHAILKALLEQVPLKVHRVDYLYVDEAQDNLLIDALVLRLICRNPNGLFWAGDTAQTISEGSSFRFNDLKAFLYRVEEDRNIAIERPVTQPSSFQLTINYRSHGGIVNCAHSVIEVITRFWPNAIDRLQPERGIVEGWKPLFCKEWETLKYRNKAPGDSSVELGAEQCILVRSDESRKKFCQQVGNVGVIMTIYESKGMEFNDVFLCNFFEDSPMDLSQWRLVLGAIDSKSGAQDLSAPSFERDESRFAGVCNELKLLYVGITRAKKNLVIIDNSDKCEPMKTVWISRSQIQELTPDIDVSHLSVDSTAEEWADFGRSLFHNKRYKQAMHCFERARRYRELKVAEAFHLREFARVTIGVASHDKQRDAFRTAANAFSACASDPGALAKERVQYYRNSAECYVRSKEDIMAAEAYVNAEEFELAARIYRKMEQFGEALQIIVDHADKIPEGSSSDLLMVCRLWFVKENQRPPRKLFSSYEEELESLKEYDFDVAQVVLLGSHERFFDAAELHLSENRPLDAIRLFIKEYLKNTANCIPLKRAADILLDNLWRYCSLGVAVVESPDEAAAQFFAMIGEVPLDSLPALTRDQILMFKAGAEQDVITLERLTASFLDRKDSNAALWILDRTFSRLPRLMDATLAELAGFLQRYYTYARMLYVIASHNDPLGDPGIRKLLAISEVSKDRYVLHPNSLLSFEPPTTNPSAVPPILTAYSRVYVTQLLKNRMRNYLHDKVHAENERTYEAKVFSQCLSFIMNDSCNYQRCPQEHVHLSSLDAKQYNARIGIHLQQMRILQLVYSALPGIRRRSVVKRNIADWLNHLYEAFFPPTHAQGSIADLEWSQIQDAHNGLSIMREWTRDAIYALNPDDFPDTFLNELPRLTRISFTFDEKDAFKYITQAKCYAHCQHPSLLRTPSEHYIVEDMITFAQGRTKHSISAGIEYLHHMLRNNLYVNLSVLCDCAEDICSSIVIALRMPQFPPLHNVVLPRGWLGLQYKFLKEKYLTSKTIHLFLDDMQTLFEMLRLESAKDVFWLEHTNLTLIHRNIFIARICRMLCILSHNVRMRDVKDRVSRMMYLLQSKDPNIRTPYFYRRYAAAMSDGCLQAILSYDRHVVTEDLVHLVHRSEAHKTRILSPRIKQIVYSGVEEIFGVLSLHLTAARSDLRVNAPVFVPRPGHTLQASLAEDHQVDDNVHISGEQPEDKELNLVDDELKEGHVAQDTEEPSSLVDGPSEREVEAARVLQTKYRERKELLRRSARTGVKAERYAIFEACLKQVQSSKWGPSPYRRLYLGPLPHLLLGLDKGIEAARTVKDKNKKCLTVEGNERLEEIGRQLSAIGSLLKQGHHLRNKLSVNAAFHNDRNADALKQAVIEVKDFVQRIPGGAPEALQEVNVAYKAIVSEKPTPSKKIKPGLNTEDLDAQF
ncbi:hypothetical protein F5I97DRAFT_1631620 [Phlebopus sp. FC_14]|nr:hypothetical protein F5I97DRAFT_1631620 [Phlebopus sp. FC_14]